MKILLLSALYPTPKEYGLKNDTRVVHYFAKEWVKLGHNVQVVNMHLLPAKAIMDGLDNVIPNKIIRYELDGVSVGLLKVQLLVPHANRCTCFQANKITSILNDYTKKQLNYVPDIIIVHYPLSFYGISLSDLGTRKVAVFHNCDVEQLKKFSKTKAEAFFKTFTKIGSRNNAIRNSLLNYYGVDSSIIYSGIPNEILCNEKKLEQKIEKKSTTLKMVFAGNLIPLKNIDIAIEAVSRLEFEYDFIIIGDGPERQKLEAKVSKNACCKNVRFVGRLSRSDTILEMRNADIFIMVSSPETFGLVYLEAMAQGCIPIACLNEGIDGVIKHRDNGYLIPKRNTDALVDVINEIRNLDYANRKRMIENAYSTAKKMTDKDMAHEYLRVMC